MAYVPQSGSVVAFQGGPFSASVTSGNASVITLIQGSVATVIIGGSVAVSVSPPANQSVSGTVGASIIGTVPVTGFPTNQNVSGSIVAWLQSTNASVITVGTAAANQSVSGTVGASVIGIVPIQTSNSSVITYIQNSVATVIIGGSIAASMTPPANQSVSGTVNIGNTNVNVGGSVVAFQGGAWSSSVTTGNASVIVIIQGSVATTGTPAANQSVSGRVETTQTGTVITSIVSTVPSSVIVGASIFGLAPVQVQNTNINIGGSVISFQGGTQITSVSGTVIVSEGADTPSATQSILVGVTANTNGSIAAVSGYQLTAMQITSGPGPSITGVLNFEGTLDGTQFYPIQGYNQATGVISSLATIEGNWMFNTAGLQGFRARVSNWSIGSITARVVASPEDARPFTQIIDRMPSVYGNISGSVAATITNTNINVSGSVVAFQGGTQITSIVNTVPSSVLVGASIFGTAPVTMSGTWVHSVVGGYNEDVAHSNNSQGLYVLSLRNDTLASVTSADLDFTPIATGPSGEQITANAPLTKWVSGNISLTTAAGGSVAILTAPGASIFTYITGVQFAGFAPQSVLMTIAGGGSILGRYVVPGGGSQNTAIIQNGIKTVQNVAITASIGGAGATTSSVFIGIQGFISKS